MSLCQALLPLALIASLALAAPRDAGGADARRARLHPDFHGRIARLGTLALVRPDVTVYEVSAGGVDEPIREWTESAIARVTAALTSSLATRGITLRPLSAPVEATGEVEEVRRLYEAVGTSILMHAYPTPLAYPAKVARFDYSLGDLCAILAPGEADGLLLVVGSDRVSSGGRKAAVAVGTAIGLLLGAVPTSVGGTAVLNLAIVDRDGTVLSFTRGGGTGYDLRNPESVARLVEQAVADLPARGR
jgi:hypothetical protein